MIIIWSHKHVIIILSDVSHPIYFSSDSVEQTTSESVSVPFHSESLEHSSFGRGRQYVLQNGKVYRQKCSTKILFHKFTPTNCIIYLYCVELEKEKVRDRERQTEKDTERYLSFSTKFPNPTIYVVKAFVLPYNGLAIVWPWADIVAIFPCRQSILLIFHGTDVEFYCACLYLQKRGGEPDLCGGAHLINTSSLPI